MPSASRRDAVREEVDGELLTVYGGDSLEAAMAAAAAGHGPGAAVRRARRVKQGVRGLLGKERYEVLVAGDPLPPPAVPVAPPKDVDSALDLLLERADAAEDRAASGRRPTLDRPVTGPDSRSSTRGRQTARSAPTGRPAPPVRPRATAAAAPASPAPAPAAPRGAPEPSGDTSRSPRTALPPVAAAHPAPDIAVHDDVPAAPPPPRGRAAAPDEAGRPQVRPSRYGRRSSDRGGPAEPSASSGYGRRAGDVLDAEVVDEVEEVVGPTGRPAPAGPGEHTSAASRRRPSPGPSGRPRRTPARAELPAAVLDELIPPAPAGDALDAADDAGASPDGPGSVHRPTTARAAASPRTAVRAAAGDGWSRAALRALGVPAAVLSRLPAEDPDDDLGWLTALGSAIAAVVPPPVEPGPDHPVVVSGHGLEGAVALLEAGVSGVAPGTLTVGDRTVPATAAELALVVRACVLA